ncbi:MAG: hypothetical protein MH204_03835, partial [Fimbriimonadaceae bacterium]|nr:hypothetical protein [Fimbriimonadaceae bacterium]
SKHVEVLEAAALVQTEKRGRSRWCRLRPEGFQTAESWLAEARSFWPGALRSLHQHLEESEPR